MPPTRALAPLDALYCQHYTEYSAKYPGNQVAILLQVGSFYEMYDSIRDGKCVTHVQAAAAACGCAVEPKPTDDPKRQRIFWGFPEVAFAKYERMLVAAGYTVVVFVQTKDGKGAVKSRPLDHISSPGTYLDEEEGGEDRCREDRILLGVCVEPYTDTAKRQQHWYGAATAFNVATGALRSLEFDLLILDGKPVLDSIRSFLALFPPVELVFTWCSPTKPPPTVAACQAMFCGNSSNRVVNVHVIVATADDGTAAADRTRLEFLRGLFKPRTALSLDHFLDIERHPYVRKSLSHLLSFVKDHNASFLTALPEHAMWSAETTTLLGNAALHQLAMIPRDRPHESLLYWLLKGVTTVIGKRALEERCVKPTADIAVLEDRQVRCAALRGTHKAHRDALVAELKGVCDVARLYRRFQLGSAGTAELVQLLRSYERVKRLLVLVDGSEPLRRHVDALLERWDAARIEASQAVVGDKIAVGTTHPWRRSVHATLDAFEDRWAALYAAAMRTKAEWETTVGESDGIQWTLKDEAPFTFTTTAKRGRILAGRGVTVEHKGASTTAILTSDTIRAANASALVLRAAWKEEVRTLWAAEWSAWCAANTEDGSLAAVLEFVGDLDVDCGLAIAADMYGYARPTYVAHEDEDGTQRQGLEVVGLRHPIVERVHTTVPYVSHSLSFGCFHTETAEENKASTPAGLLLYGVNAAGKSSLGKAVGLAVLMAQIGMPVPATTMRLVPYTGVFTRILGNDDLWLGMSSFVVEMTELRSILKYADERSLVIGDELCAGTETDSAVALVSAGVQTLEKRGVHFLFATHLHELELGQADGVTGEDVGKHRTRSYHLSVKAVGSALQYDRLLKQGSGSDMYGLEVCRGLDMDAEFLSLAFQIRKRRCGEAVGKPSRYNALVTVSSCSVCGATEGLETHHLVPQAKAKATEGRIAAGVSKNVVSNLAVLCEACHLKHHKGLLEIGGWKQTTEGRVLG